MEQGQDEQQELRNGPVADDAGRYVEDPHIDEFQDDPDVDGIQTSHDEDSDPEKPSTSVEPTRNFFGPLQFNNLQILTQLWPTYHLSTVPCKFGEECKCRQKPAKGKPKPPHKGPYCLNGLGFDKFQSFAAKKDREVRDRVLVEQRDRGLPAGLRNLGNTCYLNSYLQVCFHLLPFREAVFRWEPPPPDDPSFSPIVQSLQRLFVEMQVTSRAFVCPREIVDACELNSEQQDAQEFGQLFLTHIKEKMRGPIQEQFQGRWEEKMLCRLCGRASSSGLDFADLMLNIQDCRHLSEALRRYFSEEEVAEYRCPGCAQVGGGSKQVQLLRTPDILFVHLLRFIFDRNSGRKVKLSHGMCYPRRLDLSPFFVPESPEAANAKYELKGILVHKGNTAYSGHYYALLEDPVAEKWFKFDDEAVDQLREKQLPGTDEGEEGRDLKKAPSSNEAKGAYLLVYRRCSEQRGPAQAPDLAEHLRPLEREINGKWEELQNQAELRKDLALRKIEEGVEDMRGIWTGLQVRDRHNKPFSLGFVPIDFLKKIPEKAKEALETDLNRLVPADSSDFTLLSDEDLFMKTPLAVDKEAVDFRNRLCEHGGLSLSAMEKGLWRALDPEGLTGLFRQLRVPPTISLTEHQLCYKCMKERREGEERGSALARDEKALTAELRRIGHCSSAMAAGQEHQVWVMRKDLNKWTKIAEEVLRSAPPEDEPDAKRLRLPCPFNQASRCEHMMLAPASKGGGMGNRTLVNETILQILLSYFPDMACFRKEEPECGICLGERQQQADETWRQKQLALRYRDRLSLLLKSGKERLVAETLLLAPGQKHFLLCAKFFDSFVDWLGLKISEKKPMPVHICNSCLICTKHKGSLCKLEQEEQTDFVLLTEEEWLILLFFPEQTGDPGLVPDIQISVSMEDAVFVMEPEFCVECFEEKKDLKENLKYMYEDGEIYIQRISDPAQIYLKNGDAENGASTSGLRRSTRTSRPTVHHSKYRVTSAMTVRQLKVEVLNEEKLLPSEQRLFTEEGEELLEMRKTLGECRVAPGSVLKLLVDTDAAEASSRSSPDPQRGVPERGFRGTALAGNS